MPPNKRGEKEGRKGGRKGGEKRKSREDGGGGGGGGTRSGWGMGGRQGQAAGGRPKKGEKGRRKKPGKFHKISDSEVFFITLPSMPLPCPWSASTSSSSSSVPAHRILVKVLFEGQSETTRPVKIRINGALVHVKTTGEAADTRRRMSSDGGGNGAMVAVGAEQAWSAWSAVPGQDVSLPGHPGVVFSLLARPGLSEVTISSATLRDLAIEIKEFPRETTVVVTMSQELTLQLQGTPSVFDTSVSATLDDEDMRRSLPYDVRILCAGGGHVDAHRFVLVYQSQFFRCRFRMGGGGSLSNNNSGKDNNNNQTTPSMEIVDLTCCEYATQSLMRTVVGVMYRGCPPSGCFRLSDMLPMMYLADFLHLPNIVNFCQGVVGELLKKACPDFVVTVCGVADQLRLLGLQNDAEARLMQFHEIPQESFEKVKAKNLKNIVSSLLLLSKIYVFAMHFRSPPPV